MTHQDIMKEFYTQWMTGKLKGKLSALSACVVDEAFNTALVLCSVLDKKDLAVQLATPSVSPADLLAWLSDYHKSTEETKAQNTYGFFWLQRDPILEKVASWTANLIDAPACSLLRLAPQKQKEQLWNTYQALGMGALWVPQVPTVKSNLMPIHERWEAPPLWWEKNRSYYQVQDKDTAEQVSAYFESSPPRNAQPLFFHLIGTATDPVWLNSTFKALSASERKTLALNPNVLTRATALNQLDLVKELIHNGANVSAYDDWGFKALNCAPNEMVLTTLFEAGAKLSAESSLIDRWRLWNTEYKQKVWNDFDVLTQIQAQVITKNKEGVRMVKAATPKLNAEVKHPQPLGNFGANTNSAIPQKNMGSVPPDSSATAASGGHMMQKFAAALLRGDELVSREIFELLPKNELLSYKNPTGQSLMHMAAKKENWVICKKLLKSGVSVWDTDETGKSALWWTLMAYQKAYNNSGYGVRQTAEASKIGSFLNSALTFSTKSNQHKAPVYVAGIPHPIEHIAGVSCHSREQGVATFFAQILPSCTKWGFDPKSHTVNGTTFLQRVWLNLILDSHLPTQGFCNALASITTDLGQMVPAEDQDPVRLKEGLISSLFAKDVPQANGLATHILKHISHLDSEEAAHTISNICVPVQEFFKHPTSSLPVIGSKNRNNNWWPSEPVSEHMRHALGCGKDLSYRAFAAKNTGALMQTAFDQCQSLTESVDPTVLEQVKEKWTSLSHAKSGKERAIKWVDQALSLIERFELAQAMETAASKVKVSLRTDVKEHSARI